MFHVEPILNINLTKTAKLMFIGYLLDIFLFQNWLANSSISVALHKTLSWIEHILGLSNLVIVGA